jgi:hypothetical protein
LFVVAATARRAPVSRRQIAQDEVPQDKATQPGGASALAGGRRPRPIFPICNPAVSNLKRSGRTDLRNDRLFELSCCILSSFFALDDHEIA